MNSCLYCKSENIINKNQRVIFLELGNRTFYDQICLSCKHVTTKEGFLK